MNIQILLSAIMKMEFHMDKEYALTILLSDNSINKENIKRIEHIIKQEVNWFKVFKIAIQEQIVFIVYKNLNDNNYLWLVPDNLRFIWRTAYLGNIQYNKHLLEYSRTIETYLLQNNIHVYPIKGIVLLQLYSSAYKWRILRDIDFVIDSTNIIELRTKLQNKGFQILYFNDEDILLEKKDTDGYSVFFSKYIQNTLYANCEFCCKKIDTKLGNFFLKGLKEVGTNFYYISHLLIFYLIAEQSWKGEMLFSGEKKYQLSKLVDILFYEEICKEKNLICDMNYIINKFSLQDIINNVRKTISYYWKGGNFFEET